MKNWQLAILSGTLFGLSFIHIGLGFLVFFAFVPYLIFIKNSSPKHSFFNGLIFGFVVASITLYCMVLVEIIAFVGILIILPFYNAIVSYIIKKIQLRFTKFYLYLFPILWIGFEYFMTLGPLNFPWLNVGYSLANYYYLIQFADVFGICGLSLLILIINVIIYNFFQNRKKSLIFLILIFIFWFGYGIFMDETIHLEKENLKIGILQLNIPQNEKWSSSVEKIVKKYEEQTAILTSKDTLDIVVFPESAITTYLLHRKRYRRRISTLAKENRINIVTGFPDFQRNPKKFGQKYLRFNSATMIDSLGFFFPKYDKIRLVPFGERIPLLSTFPILEKLQFGQANFEYGKNFQLYQVNDFQFSITICFESAFSELNRKNVQNGADFILNLTNDAWYGRTAFPKEHANMNRIRAIENRVSIFRAANTGISLVANPKGEILTKTEIYKNENISEFLFTTNLKNTFFGKFGFILPIFCFWIGLFIAIYSVIFGRLFTKKL